MTGEPLDAPIRRILVGVDASVHSLAAIEEAARLAARMHADLVGVFVEDINLLHLAGLPFAREIAVTGTRDRQLDAPGMERQLRALAARARAAMAVSAERAHVRWSFRVVRGKVTDEILLASTEADLLTLGLSSHPDGRRTHLGSTAREAVSRGTRPVLLLRNGATVARPVVVMFDGTDTADRALSLAEALARADDRSLTVVVVAETKEQAGRRREAVAARLERSGTRLRLRALTEDGPRRLARLATAERAGLLVIGASSALVVAEEIQAFVDDLPCPVLLVR